MINVVGSTPSPVSPLPPSLPGDVPTPTADASTLAPSSSSTSNSGSQPPQLKRKMSLRTIVAAVVLFVLVLGGGVGLYLVRQQQDLRQQAAVGGASCEQNGGQCITGISNCTTLGGANATGNCNQGICCKGVSQPPSGGGGGGGGGGESPRSAEGQLNGCGYINNTGATTTDGSSCGTANCGGQPCGPFTFKCGTMCFNSACGASACTGTPRPPTPTPTPTRTPTPTPTLVLTPTPTPGACAQVTGSCIGKDGVSCVTYANSCEAHEKCAQSLLEQSCASLTTTPTPPTPTPTTTQNQESGQQIADSGSTTPTQVTLPSTLPQSGPEDWLKYLQIGLGVLGAGALLLLFL